MSANLLFKKFSPLWLALTTSVAFAGIYDSPENEFGPSKEAIQIAQSSNQSLSKSRQAQDEFMKSMMQDAGLNPDGTSPNTQSPSQPKNQTQASEQVINQIEMMKKGMSPAGMMDMTKQMGINIPGMESVVGQALQQDKQGNIELGPNAIDPVIPAPNNSTKVDPSAVYSTVQASNEKEKQRKEKALNDLAFQALLDKALPLSPEQIRLLHKYYDISQRVTAETPNAPPTPKSTSSIVSLEPGKVPPVVRLSSGFVTSLVFTDSTGAPWPIVSYTLGDPSTYNIQWNQRSNTLFVQSLSLYNHGNLAVTLQGTTTPVMISLVSGQKEVDFRIDYQVAGRGPKATAPIMPESSVAGASINPILINVLDGIPPKGSVKIMVSGGYGDAWVLNNKLYLRTKLTVLSPAWSATVSSPDGTHVYEMMNTPSVLASKNGQTIDLRLTGL